MGILIGRNAMAADIRRRSSGIRSGLRSLCRAQIRDWAVSGAAESGTPAVQVDKPGALSIMKNRIRKRGREGNMLKRKIAAVCCLALIAVSGMAGAAQAT